MKKIIMEHTYDASITKDENENKCVLVKVDGRKSFIVKVPYPTIAIAAVEKYIGENPNTDEDPPPPLSAPMEITREYALGCVTGKANYLASSGIQERKKRSEQRGRNRKNRKKRKTM